jgi:pilus assembly protein CpaB
MSARQLIVLGIAIIAAIGALFFIQSMNRTAPQAAASSPAGTGAPRVLVAAKPLRPGQAVAQSDLAWQPFPADGINSSYYTEQAAASALTDLVGAVSRREFLPGEPVTQGSLIKRGEAGFLAAQLPPGYRAVGVSIKPAGFSGGFIQPNDRVDAILTRSVQVGIGDQMVSEIRSSTILQNVRVLTVGEASQSAEGEGPPAPLDAATATLELTQADAEALLLAEELGDISLVLRGVEEEPPQLRAPSSAVAGAPALEQRPRPDNSAVGVRVHSFGATSETRQGGAR